MSMSIRCASRIEGVVVYARGAVVTRQIETPASWPDGPVDIVVSGISPWAEPGSIRATAQGPHRILGLGTRLVVPEKVAEGGDLRARVLGLEREAARLHAQAEELANRRDTLSALRLRPIVNSRGMCTDPSARFQDALAADTLLDQLLADLDAERSSVERAEEDNQRALASARVEFEQATSAARSLPGHPTWEVTIQLAPVEKGPTSTGASFGSPHEATAVTLCYPVGAARWWPAYSARLSSTADRAEVALEAFVAQASFEDWTGVRISLCTADLTQDARLPDLPSLRIGRAQTPRRTGYRPAPADLDTLFEAFDQSILGDRILVPSKPIPPPSFAVAPKPMASPGMPVAGAAPVFATAAGAASVEESEMDKPTYLRRHATSSWESNAPLYPPQAKGGGFARLRAAMPKKSKQDQQKVLLAGPAAPDDVSDSLAEPEEPFAEAPLEPADAWLDFDALTLAPGDASERRGRLVRAAADPVRSRLLTEKSAVIERAEPPSGPRDPKTARGQFDHRFDAEGTVDLPSNGIPHRIALSRATASLRRRFRAVPMQGAEVFREALLDNPFAAPLLGGPVEVFVDGGLLATPTIEPVGRGGTLALGLGVEDRLRVSRNARVEESTRGVLGGTTAVDHAIDIEVASALGQAIEVEVLDRMPVTDDKDAKVALLGSEPKAAPYDQAERGVPMRGGLRWSLKVPPGTKAKIAWSYRIELPSKSEVVGGNRRD
jgi:hypothetical protein